MTKPHICCPSSPSSKLGIDRDSHTISKVKPKIRIIHVYAPEIIKTDAANFRELVQRLTGKPEDKTKTPPAIDLMEKKEDLLGLQNNEDKEEDEIWRRRSKSNDKFSGFFDGFSELDGFMEELSSMPSMVN